MAQRNWRQRMGRWLRGLDAINTVVSFIGWFLKIGGLVIAMFLALAGGLAGAIVGSPAVVPITVGAISGAVLGVALALIMAARLRTLFPAGSGLITGDEHGYMSVQPIQGPARGEPQVEKSAPGAPHSDPIVRALVKEWWYSVAREAYHEAYAFLSDLVSQWDQDPPHKIIKELVQEYPLTIAREYRKDFEGSLSEKSDTAVTPSRLLEVAERYRQTVNRAWQLAHDTSTSVQEMAAYKRWKQADGRLLERTQELLAKDVFDEVREKVLPYFTHGLTFP